MFEQEYRSALANIGIEEKQIETNWIELRKCYQSSSRHYHNLSHLNHVVRELAKIREEIKDWNTLVFSIAYHDIVYNIFRKDNEHKSAGYAVKKMQSFKYDLKKTEKCRSQILATGLHELSDDSDTNFFTDADLSILGTTLDTYVLYASQIRKEYRRYPNMLYNNGRIKVLRHFLKMPRIFKSDHFANLYEEKARINMAWEIENL